MTALLLACAHGREAADVPLVVSWIAEGDLDEVGTFFKLAHAAG